MLCQLASEYERGPLQMGEIGEREAISEKYLGQIMLALRSSGLVSSVRGAQGGYYLSRAPERINLLEVFEVLEGGIFDFEDHRDKKGMQASTNVVWNQVRDAIKGVLMHYSLEDVVKLGPMEDGYLDYRI